MKIDMKVHLTEQEGKCLARLSATLNDCFAVRGLRLMEGKTGCSSISPATRAGVAMWTSASPLPPNCASR